MASSSTTLRRVLALGVLALCGGVLWAHARSYGPFMVDDAFISLRYAWRLLHGQGLTWTDGERVEGYSNLLWVLLVAGGGLLHANLVGVARGLAFAATVAGFALLLASGLRRSGLAGLAFAAVAALALALCGPMAAWSVGGMEPPLQVALVLAAAVASERLVTSEAEPPPVAILSLSLPLALLCLLRPDGAIFVLAAGLALPWGRKPRVAAFRLALWVVLPSVACVLGQLVFRFSYYGDLLPNTYYAKGAFSWAHVARGWTYVRRSLRPMAALWTVGVLTLALATFRRELRQRIGFAFLAALLWLLYVVRIGGDIFPQRRHLLVAFALLAFLLSTLLQWLWQRRHPVRWLAWLAGPILLAWLGGAQRKDVGRVLALIDKGHWSGRPVGQFLRKAFAKQRPLLAVDAAGTLPYFYQLPCLDMLGLTDRYLARHPPPGVGAGFLGHELGDGRYVLSRKPDLVAFWTPVGGDRPRYRSGKEMVEQPGFHRLYQAITFETDDSSHMRTRLWLRRRDGRLGVQDRGDRIEIPGYLLQGGDDVVRLDTQGRLYVALKPDVVATVRDVRLPTGRLVVQVVADGPATVQMLAGGVPLVADAEGVFALPATTSDGVDITLRAAAATRVFGLAVTRPSN